MTTEVVQRTPAQELAARARSEEYREQVALALSEGQSPDKFVRVMATALLENPSIANGVDHGSILNAGLKAAADGLLPDGREAAFVVFNVKGGGKKAQYMPMIGGFRKIAGEHGWSLRTAVVYEHDVFEYEQGLDERLIHRAPRPGQDRGEPIAAYAVGAHRDGRKEFLVMDAAEINKRRQVSKSKDDGPWTQWPELMWEKTVGKRLFKKLPLGEQDERVARVIEASEVVERGQAAVALYGGEPPNAVRTLPAAGQEVTGDDEPAPQQPPVDDVFADEPGDDDEPVEAEVVEDESVKADADEAGKYVVTGGSFKGKTLAAIAEKKPSWFVWACETETFAGCLSARAYAKHYLPAQYTEAMAKLETKETE